MAERAGIHHDAAIPPRVVNEIDEDSFMIRLCAHAVRARQAMSEEGSFRRRLASAYIPHANSHLDIQLLP
jgi:hypothetical protein